MGMPSLQELCWNLEDHETTEDELESLEDLKEDEDLALLSKKYQKFLRLQKGGNKKKSSFPKKSSNKDDQQNSSIPTCFECKKPSHVKPDCAIYLRRLLENERKKRIKQLAKKAHLAT